MKGVSMTRISRSNICSAMSERTIGTKVLDEFDFLCWVTAAIQNTDFTAQRVPGQAFITLPSDAYRTVRAGVGRRTLDPSDYHINVHRGEVGLYLIPERAGKVEGLAVVVYTRDAYMADPDVQADEEETRRINRENPTHVLVAVLAFSGPKSPHPKGTFIHNLAGGNKEAALYSADEIRGMAKDIDAYWSEWCIVADYREVR